MTIHVGMLECLICYIFCHSCALQGIVPNEEEQIQLRKMYAPFLNMSDHDEETSNVIINQIYSGDDRGN